MYMALSMRLEYAECDVCKEGISEARRREAVMAAFTGWASLAICPGCLLPVADSRNRNYRRRALRWLSRHPDCAERYNWQGVVAQNCPGAVSVEGKLAIVKGSFLPK